MLKRITSQRGNDSTGIQEVPLHAWWVSKHGLRTSPGPAGINPVPLQADLSLPHTCSPSHVLRNIFILLPVEQAGLKLNTYKPQNRTTALKRLKKLLKLQLCIMYLWEQLQVVRFPALSVFCYDLDNIKHIYLGLYFICLKSLQAVLVYS